MLNYCNGQARREKLSDGFTLVELVVTIAVLAVILALAFPSFSKQIRSGRAEMAAQNFSRAVASARAAASQTGRRTDLSINTAPVGVSGCSGPAWVVSQGTTLLSCLTMQDFTSRFAGTTFTETALTITYLPTGIGTNGNDQTYVFMSGSSSKNVLIRAGGTVDLL